ncbi:MAG TPA: hypothetical protein VJT73_13845, partial [Polyangiaceae bacterium]|nr:hypothetical protein [Polyangiaceae bacterium]
MSLPAVPCLRLFVESVVVASGDALVPDLEEKELPALKLSFDYAGTILRAGDARRQFFVGDGAGVAAVERDFVAEGRAARALESFGAVDVRCLDDFQTGVDSEADYLLAPNGSVHAWCSFAASAIAELRTLGFRIEIDAAYPYIAVNDDDDAWFAAATAEEDGDWFSLELGIEIEGRRINLLETLVEWVESCSEDAGIEALMRIPARFRALPTGEGGYVVVPPERLCSILRV